MDNDTILVVDDNKSDIKLLVNILSKAGFHMCSADSEELALDAINTTHPALILLAVRMPGMDGFACAGN